jgi:hypothetical protein
MTIAIIWFLIGLMAIGGLMVIGLVVGFIANDRSDNDLYSDINCDCYHCSRFEPIDACSSECDQDCRDNDHYPGEDWRR